MKQNLFDIDYNNSSEVNDLSSSKTCKPCSSECEKTNRKINGRKLSDIKREEISHIVSVFNVRE